MNKNQKIIISILIVWTFLHVYLLFEGLSDGNEPMIRDFYPFTAQPEYSIPNFNVESYDYREFLVYAIGPWLGLLIYKILKKS